MGRAQLVRARKNRNRHRPPSGRDGIEGHVLRGETGACGEHGRKQGVFVRVVTMGPDGDSRSSEKRGVWPMVMGCFEGIEGVAKAM